MRHETAVEISPGRYPYRPTCTCGWQTRGYVASHAAQHMADAHQQEASTAIYPNGPKTGEGTSTELALAATVALAVAMYYCADATEFFVAGHEHEGLSKGSVSVAWESGIEWVYDWPHSDRAHQLREELNIWFEPINGCILAVHRND